MKRTSHTTFLLLTAAGAGLAGFALRLALYRVGFDDRGILSASHPLHLACLALTVCAAVYLLLNTRSQDEGFPRFAAAGMLSGVLLLLHALSLAVTPAPGLGQIRHVADLGCAAAMVLLATPLPGRRTRMAGLGVVCLCFCLEMLCRYQDWSGNPQIPDYCFHVLASVFLCLCTYHRLALDAGLGKPWAHRFCCLIALCLCLISTAGPEGRSFYLSGAAWALFALHVPQPPVQPENTPAEPETEEEEIP